mmetsp:Transcript_34616/g.68398  ORF Transcript_34616/g.68398 Transcript_34616/m.68398 type:complete len:173 (+) Transcript_34616:170-688(+)
MLLYCFNSQGVDELSLAALCEATGIGETEAIRLLVSLTQMENQNLLVKDRQGAGCDGSTKFKVNSQFLAPRKFFDIKLGKQKAGPSEAPKDVKAELGAADMASRKQVLEAAIVKVMKERRAVSYNDLFAELVKNVDLFKPNSQMIKTSIHTLMEREYIQRDDQDMSRYIYIP